MDSETPKPRGAPTKPDDEKKGSVVSARLGAEADAKLRRMAAKIGGRGAIAAALEAAILAAPEP